MPTAPAHLLDRLHVEHGLAFLAIASPISKSFSYAALGVTAALFLLDWRRGLVRPRATPVDGAILLWAASTLLSTATSLDPFESVADLNSLGYWAILYLAAWGVADGARLERLLALWLVAGAFAASQGIAEVALGFDLLHESGSHGSGFFTGHLPFGHYQAMLFAVAFALLRESHERREQLRRGLLVVLYAAAVVASKGRGPWLALAAVALAIAFAGAPRRLVAALALVAALQLAVVARDPGGLGAYYRSYVAVDREERSEIPDETLYSNLWRLSMWREGLRMFATRPVLGTGVESMGALSPAFHVPFDSFGVAHLHSNYVEVLATRGFLGLTAFFAVGLALAAALFRAVAGAPAGVARAAVVGALGALLIHGVHGLTYYSIGSAPIQMGFYWIAGLGLGVALGGEDRRPARFPLDVSVSFVLMLVAVLVLVVPWLQAAPAVIVPVAAIAALDAGLRIWRRRAGLVATAATLAFVTVAVAAGALLVPLAGGEPLAGRVLAAAAAPYVFVHGAIRLRGGFVERRQIRG